MGSKQKPTLNVMSWKSPFCYDNIKKHLIGQHPEKGKEYLRISNDANDTFLKKELCHFAICCNLTYLVSHGLSMPFFLTGKF